MRGFLQRQWERLVRQSYRLRFFWPVWRYLLNRRSAGVWQLYLATHTISGAEREVADVLARDGIAAVPFSRLFPEGGGFLEELEQFALERLNEPENQHAIEEYQEVVRRRVDTGEKAGKMFKDFRVNLWYVADEERHIELANPYTRLVLAAPVLEIVSSYMGLAAKFAYGGLQRTILVPEGAPEHLSQRWHRDPEDKKFVRMFLYLNDVTDRGTGPFMYLKGSQYGGRWRSIFPQIPPAGCYPPQGAVEKLVSQEDIAVCLARAGTLIFADTSGLHRGGYSTRQERRIFVGTFFSDAAIVERSFDPLSDGVTRALEPLAAYAVR